MANMRVRQTQHQKMILNQAQQMNLEILALNQTGILSFLMTEAQENPAVDPDSLSMEISRITSDSELSESVTFVSDYVMNRRSGDTDEENSINWNIPLGSYVENSFPRNLLDQAGESGISGELRRTVETLILSLDHQGYLDRNIFGQLIQSTRILKEARAVLMDFEPRGSGSFSTSEYIAFQLREKGELSEPVICFIEDNLEDIFLKSTDSVRERLPMGSPEVEELRSIIRGLNPYPSYGYSGGDSITALRPDARVELEGDDVRVLINSDLIPEIRINEDYMRILESSDSEDRTLLTDYLSRVRNIAEAIRRRNTTLRNIIGEICRTQKDFLKGVAAPVNLTQKEIAQRAGVSESTVSRAVKDKYIEIAGRILPLAVFFRNLKGQTGRVLPEPDILTEDHRRIKELIEGENPSKPLSDGRLSEILKEEGRSVPRRTVAKYRTDMGIPIYTARKK